LGTGIKWYGHHPATKGILKISLVSFDVAILHTEAASCLFVGLF
jgi:hypothetical protein